MSIINKICYSKKSYFGITFVNILHKAIESGRRCRSFYYFKLIYSTRSKKYTSRCVIHVLKQKLFNQSKSKYKTEMSYLSNDFSMENEIYFLNFCKDIDFQ